MVGVPRRRNTPTHGGASNHGVTRRTSGSAASDGFGVGSRVPQLGQWRMDIVLNGEPRSLTRPLTVLELLQGEGLGERRVAVEVNGEIVPRGRHGEHALRPGDRVEIVHALGGG